MSVIVQIMLLDIVFSLDSVITAVGMADELWVMITAVIVAVGIMMLAAEPISAFVHKHPTVKMLALSFLLLIGMSLLLEGFGQHIPKGYIYFAMGFSVFVEMINLRLRGKESAGVPGRAPGGGAVRFGGCGAEARTGRWRSFPSSFMSTTGIAWAGRIRSRRPRSPNGRGDYSAAFGADGNYTPQMIVDGTAQLVGSDRGAAIDAIRHAAGEAHVPVGVNARIRGAGVVRVSVDAPAAPSGSEPIDIVVALAEDGLTSSVTRGENRGRTLTHIGVVRRHQVIGALDRDAFVAEGEWRLNAAWLPSRIRVVAFLQGRKSRRVYGAASASVQQ